jgi:microcin C transport system permease protein
MSGPGRRRAAFAANRPALWALRLLLLLGLVSALADVLANDQPLLLHLDGQWHLPFLHPVPETALGGAIDAPADFSEPEVEAMARRKGAWLLWPPIRSGPRSIAYDHPLPAPAPPGHGHLLGTDDQGRDVLARLIHGLRNSLAFGLILTLLSGTAGVLVGAAMGYLGGAADLLGQRLLELWSGLPLLYVLIALSAAIVPGFWSLLLLMALFSWTALVGVTRAEFLRLRRGDVVRAASALGASDLRIALRHVLPSALGPILAALPFLVGGAVTMLTSLDFLGFGLPPGTASLGELVMQARANLHAPWLAAAAFGSLTSLLVLLALVAEGLHDAIRG